MIKEDEPMLKAMELMNDYGYEDAIYNAEMVLAVEYLLGDSDTVLFWIETLNEIEELNIKMN